LGKEKVKKKPGPGSPTKRCTRCNEGIGGVWFVGRTRGEGSRWAPNMACADFEKEPRWTAENIFQEEKIFRDVARFWKKRGRGNETRKLSVHEMNHLCARLQQKKWLEELKEGAGKKPGKKKGLGVF